MCGSPDKKLCVCVCELSRFQFRDGKQMCERDFGRESDGNWKGEKVDVEKPGTRWGWRRNRRLENS